MNSSIAIKPSWPEYLKDVDLFSNAVRLRYLIWTIQQRFAPGSRLLEAGCGSGTTAVLLSEMGYHVTAIDRELPLIERIRDRYGDWLRSGGLRIQAADMFALPWEGQEFDLAYHQGVLEHFEDNLIVDALREQRRVAKWLIFDVPNRRYPEHPYGDERLLSLGEWRRLIERAGWKLVDLLGRDFPKPFYILPHFMFSRAALDRIPWFSRHFAVTSIFIARCPEATR